MNRFLKRLRTLWRRKQLERDLEDELRFHQEMQAQESADARDTKRRLGHVTLLKESLRELWSFNALETLWQDTRYAFRTLAHSPGFTIIAVAALALGIGANTTIYTVVSSALAFNMGVDHIERLVLIMPTDASRRSLRALSLADYLDFRAELKSIQSLVGYRMVSANVSDSSSLPERYWNVQMSANGFRVARAKPVLGRDFSAEDERPDAKPVLMLSYHVWQDRYGKDPSILGRVIRVDDVPRSIVGVMPPKMQFPENTDLWTPLLPELVAGRQAQNVVLFGRLADGVKLATARAEMDTVARRLEAKAPETYKGLVADVHPFLDAIGIYSVRGLLIAVEFAVGFVLLIACADVANLLLARAAARTREISIRIAIGAGRARIIRQLLVESMLLASVAGWSGWLVAFAGLRWFDAATSKAPKPSWVDFSMNAQAFLYLAAITLGAGILFGLAPAVRLAKTDVNGAVKDGGHGAAGGQRSQRLASALVVFEMALCIVLLIGAGLSIRSSINTYSAPIGVNPANVLTMHITLPEAKYPRPDDLVSFHRRLNARLASLPGVDVASIASALPTAFVQRFSYELEDKPPDDADHIPATDRLVIGTDYFRAMQVRVRRGRVFRDSDGSGGPPVAIVNQSFAAQIWPGQDPIGKRLRLARERAVQPWLTVVGIVPDIQQNFRRPLERGPLIYLPYAGEPQRTIFILARTAVPPAKLGEAFRREVQSLDENLPVYDVNTLEERIAMNRLNNGAFGVLFTIFAAVALVLALVGLYAVVAHGVSQRTREIGVRMALGGTVRDIAGMVFAQGLRQIAIGLAIGLPLAFGVTRVLRATLVGVSPGDPLTFAGVIVVLLLAGVLGCALPARRAMRVDPAVALRCD